MAGSVLLIDNYDSFVYNLARYFEELGVETVVRRNDDVTVSEIAASEPAAIVISPGPCTPAEAGVSVELIQKLGESIPILGVCLGHQAIGAALGGQIIRAKQPVHGRTSWVHHPHTGLFAGCANPLRVARYHSLIIEKATLPDCLAISAQTANGTIMGVQHRDWPLFGVQFHPESILTQQGHQILLNFLAIAGVQSALPSHVGDLPQLTDHTDDFFQRSIAHEATRLM